MNAAGYRNDRIFRLYVALFLVDFMSEHGQEFKRHRTAIIGGWSGPIAACLQGIVALY
jgi:hypothetical protein